MNATKSILIVEDQFVEANHLRLMLRKAGYHVRPIARSVEEAIVLVEEEKPDLVLLDIFLSGKQTGIDLARYLKKQQTGFIYLSANSNEEILNEAKATQPFGFLVKPFREKDLLIAMQIAAYHQEYGLDSALRKEAFFQYQLKGLHQKNGDRKTKILKVVEALQPLLPYDFAVAVLKTAQNDLKDVIGYLRTGFNEYEEIEMSAFQIATNLKTHELQSFLSNVRVTPVPQLYNGIDFENMTEIPGMKKAIKMNFGMRSNLTLPISLFDNGESSFLFSFFSRRPNGFTREHLELCERLQFLMGGIIHDIVFQSVLTEEKHKPAEEKILVKTSVTKGLKGIIGKSPLLLQVFDHIMQVAPAETSVLITGESGTGKESIADNIHQLSPRKDGPLIKVNCAALPPNLIESELFGHEKGAFTGASDKRIGKFELAQNGTIFLDEIGEMPLEMQAKLLRVLQQREIERIGGKDPVKINVRIVAATNRNLEKEVADGQFRLDLYYRLNVFPLHLPALRERNGDIELLANHFLQTFNKKNNKNIRGFSDQALASLRSYSWPGNIRELENMVERSALLTKEATIENIPIPTIINQPFVEAAQHSNNIHKTIEENEREHIVRVLRQCNGKIRGSGGAAEILGVPPTTLASKIKKLGIQKDYFTD
jgi:DNA-binding NtrC family response regulator